VKAENVNGAPASTPQPATRNPRRRLMKVIRKLIFPTLGFVGIVVVWQLAVSATHTPSYIFPTPGEVIQATRNEPGLLWSSVLVTAQTAALGLAIAVVAGCVIAVLLGLSPALERTLFPYAVIIQTTPTVAIAPIVVIVLGPNTGSLVVLVVLISFFPMLSNTLVGLNSVDPDLRGVFYLYRSSRMKTLLKLRLPNSVPYIVSGLKVASGLSVIGAIVGEYVAGVGGAQGGLGYLLGVAASQLNTAYLVATALAGSLMGLLFFGVVAVVSRLLLTWHDPGATREVKGGKVAQLPV
jgi:NitT/TauT family transport system permease protein